MKGTPRVVYSGSTVNDVKPKHFDVPGLRTFFGFEVGRPAYPAYDDSWKDMIARESDVDGLL